MQRLCKTLSTCIALYTYVKHTSTHKIEKTHSDVVMISMLDVDAHMSLHKAYKQPKQNINRAIKIGAGG